MSVMFVQQKASNRVWYNGAGFYIFADCTNYGSLGYTLDWSDEPMANKET
jgi:hypothetical protein